MTPYEIYLVKTASLDMRVVPISEPLPTHMETQRQGYLYMGMLNDGAQDTHAIYVNRMHYNPATSMKHRNPGAFVQLAREQAGIA